MRYVCLRRQIVVLLLALLTIPVSSLAATLTVCASGCTFANLQAALDAAQPGDEVVLTAAETFVGQFTLPVKAAGPVITIRSSAPLPARRITPDDASLLPTISSGVGAAALFNVAGSSNWRLDGIQFTSNTGGAGNIIELQDASNITLDRILIVGGASGQKRAIYGNGQNITLTRSHIANIWDKGSQSQAFNASDGAGPYRIVDNYLEATGENIMFGGADSASPDRVPADVLVENNHFSKRLEWQGGGWAVYNLLELKSAKRVTIRNNLFERNWPDGQDGYAFQFTPRSQDGGAPWSVVEDVLVENNIIREVENGFGIIGRDNDQPSGRGQRITIRKNLVIVASTVFKLGGEIGELIVDHNTFVNPYELANVYLGDVWVPGDPAPRPGQYAIETFTYTNNLAYHGQYGYHSDVAGGTGGLNATVLNQQYVWTHNVLAGQPIDPYPDITWFPTVAEHEAEFNPDYTLVAGSSYHNAATDQTDLGWTGGGSGGGSTPYPDGTPHALPGSFEAENFDNGANGTAYSDESAGNEGGAYRSTDVDIAADGGASNGFTVGWVGGQEWLKYTVNVATAGVYDIAVRVASAGAGGTFHIEVGGVDKTGPMTVPDTGGWDIWTTISRTGVSLDAGQQVWRAVMDTASPATLAVGNLDVITVSASAGGQSPYDGAPIPVGGTFEAENFDLGGEGVAYHDAVGGNAGGAFRTTEDVDILPANGNSTGYVINNIQTGEWLEYTIGVATTGTYTIELHASSEYTTSRFHIEIDGVDVSGSVTVPNTVSWWTFQFVNAGGVALSAGTHVLRIHSDEEYFNLDAIRIISQSP